MSLFKKIDKNKKYFKTFFEIMTYFINIIKKYFISTRDKDKYEDYYYITKIIFYIFHEINYFKNYPNNNNKSLDEFKKEIISQLKQVSKNAIEHMFTQKAKNDYKDLYVKVQNDKILEKMIKIEKKVNNDVEKDDKYNTYNDTQKNIYIVQKTKETSVFFFDFKETFDITFMTSNEEFKLIIQKYIKNVLFINDIINKYMDDYFLNKNCHQYKYICALNII